MSTYGYGHYHKEGERPFVLRCGGRSPLTGKKVGERHRWGGGGWGKGHCDFCGRTLEQVLSKPAPAEITLEKALEGN